jgi:hypothetical protein
MEKKTSGLPQEQARVIGLDRIGVVSVIPSLSIQVGLCIDPAGREIQADVRREIKAESSGESKIAVAIRFSISLVIGAGCGKAVCTE